MKRIRVTQLVVYAGAVLLVLFGCESRHSIAMFIVYLIVANIALYSLRCAKCHGDW